MLTTTTYILTYLPTYLLAYLPTYLLSFLPTCYYCDYHYYCYYKNPAHLCDKRNTKNELNCYYY
jgi:hypothetical protein